MIPVDVEAQIINPVGDGVTYKARMIEILPDGRGVIIFTEGKWARMFKTIELCYCKAILPEEKQASD